MKRKGNRFNRLFHVRSPVTKYFFYFSNFLIQLKCERKKNGKIKMSRGEKNYYKNV